MRDHEVNRWTMSTSFNQPYGSFNLWDNPYIKQQAQKNAQEEATLKEMSLLESIDEQVQNMLTFPDVESILNTIKGEKQ